MKALVRVEGVKHCGWKRSVMRNVDTPTVMVVKFWSGLNVRNQKLEQWRLICWDVCCKFRNLTVC